MMMNSNKFDGSGQTVNSTMWQLHFKKSIKEKTSPVKFFIK